MPKPPRSRKSNPVTADDVATHAGVSRWTVNRAFKPGASVSSRTREKVMQAAHELGYSPDLMAASLASNRSNLVALLVDDFSNPHKLVMLEKLTAALRDQDWDTLLVHTRGEFDASAALLKASQRRVDAAILIGSGFNDSDLETALGARKLRKLLVFARNSTNPNTVSICCDDTGAMDTIADFVIEKGYRNPLFFAGPQSTSAHLTRKERFLDRWQTAFGWTPAFTSIGRYDPQLAFAHMCSYLASLPTAARPDILVCENDALAMGAIDAIRFGLKMQTPEDIAVIGFDDVPQAANPNYQLTTYRQPLDTMVAGMVQLLKGDEDRLPLERFKGQLVVRASA